jgi:hypothetical protein
MNYKSQPYLSSSSERSSNSERISIRPSWGCSTVNLRDIRLLNPWIDYDSTVRPGLTSRRIRWNTVLGIGLATAVSASIWTGLVLAVARVWK